MSLISGITGIEKSGEPELCNAQNNLPPPFQWELCMLFGVARRVDDFNRVSTFIMVVVGWNREGEYRKEGIYRCRRRIHRRR